MRSEREVIATFVNEKRRGDRGVFRTQTRDARLLQQVFEEGHGAPDVIVGRFDRFADASKRRFPVDERPNEAARSDRVAAVLGRRDVIAKSPSPLLFRQDVDLGQDDTFVAGPG